MCTVYSSLPALRPKNWSQKDSKPYNGVNKQPQIEVQVLARPKSS